MFGKCHFPLTHENSYTIFAACFEYSRCKKQNKKCFSEVYVAVSFLSNMNNILLADLHFHIDKMVHKWSWDVLKLVKVSLICIANILPYIYSVLIVLNKAKVPNNDIRVCITNPCESKFRLQNTLNTVSVLFFTAFCSGWCHLKISQCG